MTRLGHGTLKLNRDWTDSAEITAAAVTRAARTFPDLRVETTHPANRYCCTCIPP